MEQTSIETIDSWNDAAWTMRYSGTREALNISFRSFEASQTLGYEKGSAYASLHIAACSFLLSELDDSGLRRLMDALAYFEGAGDASGQSKALNYLANVYDSYGQYEKALHYSLRGLPIARDIAYQEGIGDLLSTCGNIYLRLADYDHALQSYAESLQIRLDANELKAAASSMNLMARAYASKGDFENSLIYYRKSIQLREEQQDHGALPWSFLGLAALYEKMQDPERAMVYYSRCLSLNKTKDKRLELHCLIGTARYQFVLQDTARGISDLQQALALALELNAKPLLYEVHALLASLYEMKGDAVQALTHFRNFQRLKEEVLSQESGNRLKNQQISFALENSRQEAEIHRLRHVELKGAYDEIEEKNREITASITYALRIQQALLPKTESIQQALPKSFIFFQPKDIVSGDFYWFAEKHHSGSPQVFLAAADCTGHGVPGAFMSMLSIEKLNDACNQSSDVSQILTLLNRSMKKALGQSGSEGETRDGMDIALLFITSGKDGLTHIEYAAANRPLWLIRSGSKEVIETKATKVAIGGYTSDEQVFEKHELKLMPGDAVYIFSDGYADQFNAAGKKLMSRKFKEILLSLADETPKKQKEILASTYQKWMGTAEQIDDVLVIGMKA
jgi:serine phosphatase RsbU (regulator of sigma subunit)